MTEDQRIRRAALLCCHLTRNLAYYHAGWKELNGTSAGQFWTTVLGNFIDTAVIEWSKLFGDEKGKHHWKRLIADHADFRKRLMAFASIDEHQWLEAWNHIKDYRDKFLAHLDSDETMHVPHMDIPHRMVTFYYDELRKLCSTAVWGKLPANVSVYYDQCYNEAIKLLRLNPARHDSLTLVEPGHLCQ